MRATSSAARGSQAHDAARSSDPTEGNMRVPNSTLAQERLAAFYLTAAAAVIASGVLFPAPAWALTCSSTNVPDCRPCKKAVCVVDGDFASWVCQADSTKNGISCSDGNACTTGDVCSNGACVGTPVTCTPIDACHTAGTCSASTGTCSVGTLTCVPGVPGPITGPSTSIDGSYVLTWGGASGVVDHYVVFENGVAFYNTAGLSATLAGKGDGSYTYKVQACNSAGCSAFTADFVVSVLFPPGVPAAFSVPTESGPNYTVSWAPGSGRSDRYELGESQDNGGTWTTNSVTTTSVSYTNKAYGTYTYRVRACNPSGCSAYASAQNTSVVVLTWLSALPDTPVVSPNVPVQGWVGTLAGTPSTEGGAATYRVPIEVPPGRAGMQPDLALTYSSRNGNSIAGVGWSVSGTSSIYRCPRTLTQDGANRTVQHDNSDQLCFDGQRLVAAAGTVPGAAVSEYRTEVDRFDRIRLNGMMSSWNSYLLVEHKSGRVSRFEPLVSSGGSAPPDVWYLVRESDRQGNCVAYNYSVYSVRGSGSDPERVLTSILYTGTSTSISGSDCSTGVDARSVEFAYTGDRSDKRTTYRFGVASPATVRLAAISTKVGGQYVRRYELSYTTSGATGRSLLQGVTLCAGASCGVEKLPSTTFNYQQDPPSFDFSQVSFAGQTLTTDWRIASAGDFDGDGRREHVYDYFDPSTGQRTRYLDVTKCTQTFSPLDPKLGLAFDVPAEVLHLESSADIDGDGRADMIGTQGGFLTFATFGSCPTPWIYKPPTNLPLDASTGVFASPVDYDGDGILDLRIGSASSDTIVRRRTKDLQDWNSNVDTFQSPLPPNFMAPQLGRDINGDGLVDTVFDTPPNSASQDSTKITFFRGVDQMRIGGPAQAYATYYLADLTVGRQAPVGAFGDHPQRRWIDVNGDGLLDIYEPGTVWINQGGAIGNPNMFRPVSVAMPPNPPSGVDPANYPDRAKYAFAMDVDGDGADDLLVPNVRTISYCGGNHSAVYGADNAPAWFCGADFDTAPSTWRSYDQSVFQWNAYKFVEQADGTYALVSVSTNLQAPINTAIPVTPVDWDGDGITDVHFQLPKGVNGGFYMGLATSALGPYLSRARARAPDLLIGVANGVGANASWTHQPLSNPDTIAVGCTCRRGSRSTWLIRMIRIFRLRRDTSTSPPRCGQCRASTSATAWGPRPTRPAIATRTPC